jgi:hypothetical protein
MDAPLRVHRLRLRAPGALLAAAQQALQTRLEGADWPEPGGEPVLLVRRLHVRASAEAWPRASAAAARAALAQAVDADAPAAAQARVLRFADAAAYRAWRIAGLLGLLPTAAAAVDRTTPAGTALAALLTEAPLELPLLFQRLAVLERRGATGLRRALWTRLAGEAAGEVLARVGAATGYGRSLSQAWRRLGEATPSPTATAAEPRSRTLEAAWGLPPEAVDPAARLLAALLQLWQERPSALVGGDAAPQLSHLASQDRAPAAGTSNRTPAEAEAPHDDRPSKPTAPAATGADPDAWAAPSAAGREPPSGSSPATPSAKAVARRAAVPGGASSAPARRAAGAPEATSPNADAAIAATAPIPPPVGIAEPALQADLLTAFGGRFLLLSALALPPFERRLLSLDEPQAGWREWLRLVQALSARLAPAPDGHDPFTDDPGRAWALTAAQCSAAEAAHTLRWPPEVAAPLLDSLAARHGEPGLRAALAPRPARLRAQPTRLELHFRLADADLDIRRSGLDTDPGWMPALGRVLRWFYGGPHAPAAAPTGLP